MEIAGLSSVYLDNIRDIANNASSVHNQENFANILERIYRSQNADSDSSALENSTLESPVNYARMPIDKTDQLYQLCLELETFIVKNLINGMRNTVQKSSLADNSFAGKMYEDMLYDEYAKEFTKSANFGLAEQAYRQLAYR